MRGRTYLGRRWESDQESRYDSNIITGPPREPGAVAVFHMKNSIGCGRKAQDGTVVVSKPHFAVAEAVGAENWH